MNEWINYCDYYDSNWMPHINYFDNSDHLQQLVNVVDVSAVSNNMKEFNKKRQHDVYELWTSLLQKI